MNEKLIAQMTEVVEATMKRFKTDFYEYDKPYIEAATPDKFPMVWSIAECHTELSRLGEYKSQFNKYEQIRMDYARGVKPFAINWESSLHSEDTFYLLTPDEMRVITREQFKEIVRDVVTPVIVNWEREHGKLEAPKPVDFKIHGITFSELKALIQDCRDHDSNSLWRCLNQLRHYSRHSSNHVIDVYYNKRCNEFFFQEKVDGVEWLCGGIIFHGWLETGYKENFAVQLNPTYGWSIHT